MFIVLNRLRGTWAWMAKVNGIILGLIFGLFTMDWILGVSIAVAYLAGESMGWGKWIGAIMNQNYGPATEEEISDKEGTSNGIHFIANLLIPETKSYYWYSVLALAIRGFYWFAITLLPLVVLGYTSIVLYLVSTIILGIAFPVSVILGAWTAQQFNFRYKFFDMWGTWEHAEVWYGLVLDIIILTIIYFI